MSKSDSSPSKTRHDMSSPVKTWSSPTKRSSPAKTWSSPQQTWSSPQQTWSSPAGSPYKRKIHDTISIGGYIWCLSPPKKSRSNKMYFDFKLNCGTESIKCVCFDIDKFPFFESVNGITNMGAHMVNVTRPVKDVIVSYHTKVSKYKPEFPYSEFKKPTMDLEYVINEAEIYDEVDIVGKLFNFSEQKVTNAGNKYIECVLIDVTNRERSLKVFGDFISKVKENSPCKLTDLKVVLGSDQRKVLHTTTSTTFIAVTDENVVGIKAKEVTDIEVTATDDLVLEGTVISIDMASLTILHTCTRCSASVEIDSGFYCCSSCNMMGTMESITTSKPKIAFCFKDTKSDKHYLQTDATLLENFTGHTILNKVKLAMHLCKMPPFLIKVNNSDVTSMELKDVKSSDVTNIELKDVNSESMDN